VSFFFFLFYALKQRKGTSQFWWTAEQMKRKEQKIYESLEIGGQGFMWKDFI